MNFSKSGSGRRRWTAKQQRLLTRFHQSQLTAEHLLAIALQTGRVKDKIRITQFLESEVIDRVKLGEIITRHGLLAQWQAFSDKYLEENT